MSVFSLISPNLYILIILLIVVEIVYFSQTISNKITLRKIEINITIIAQVFIL